VSAWPLIGPYRVIESLTLTAPLGVRFHDAATDRIVSDGLRVMGYQPLQPVRRIRATANRSGVFSFGNLPSLRGFEVGRRDEKFWSSPIAQPREPLIVEVVDYERRFIPFRFEVVAPHRGIYVGDDLQHGSPPQSLGVPLFSASSRAAPAAKAVLRAELHEPSTSTEQIGRPAAWAVLEGYLGNRLLAKGMADEAGRVTLIFPWPEIPHPFSGGVSSPPRGPALRDQTWTIQMQAYYQRLPAESPWPNVVPALPVLRDVLEQSPATLWKSDEANAPLTEAQLNFGGELIVSSLDHQNGEKLPALLISPAGSPP
jgi:hypothetical protein